MQYVATQLRVAAQDLAPDLLGLVLLGGLGSRKALIRQLELDEMVQIVLKDLYGSGEGLLRAEDAVGLDPHGELVAIERLAGASVLDAVGGAADWGVMPVEG